MDGVNCEHEWEQVWFESAPVSTETPPRPPRLVGPFRCRKCRIVKPETYPAEPPKAKMGAPVKRHNERGAAVLSAWEDALSRLDIGRAARRDELRAMYLDGIGEERRTPEDEAWLRQYLAQFEDCQ